MQQTIITWQRAITLIQIVITKIPLSPQLNQLMPLTIFLTIHLKYIIPLYKEVFEMLI